MLAPFSPMVSIRSVCGIFQNRVHIHFAEGKFGKPQPRIGKQCIDENMHALCAIYGEIQRTHRFVIKLGRALAFN